MNWIVIILLVAGSLDAWGGESLAVLTARADWACINFQTTGVCRRNTPPYVGVRVRYWQPVLFVETVKRSGESGIMEYRSLTASRAGADRVRARMREATGIDGEPSAGCQGMADTGVLQFTEAHVFGFPLSDAFSTAVEAPCEGPPDLGAMVSYFSEQDAEEWRMATRESQEPMAVITRKSGPVCDRFGIVLPGLCVGTWGALYPRTGFTVHASDAIASGLAAFRAVDIAALKPFSVHQVMSPVLFWPSVRDDRMQMVSPVVRRCMGVGADPRFWENGTRSSDGRYVWIYWRKKECCLF